jgi:acetyltransferase-like isoleucine patch superfamily enzyme
MWQRCVEVTDVKIHPTAIVESDSIGEGTMIWAFVHIMDGAVVGAGCKFGDHAFVETGSVIGDRVTVKNNCLIWHGVTIGDDSFIGPNVVFTNDMNPRAHRQSGPEDWLKTHVERGVSIGANSTIVCGTTLGENSMIGAGSVVTKDVKRHELVAGNPARRLGWVCECGTRLDSGLVCSECGRKYVEDNGGLMEVEQ